MFFPSPTAASTRTGISLLQVAMIVLVNCGILLLEILFIPLRDIKMLFIAWDLMCHLEIEFVLDHLIKLQKSGTL